MAASKQDISGWFEQGLAQGATNLLVICDTFDHEDFPVFAYSEAEAWELDMSYTYGDNMKRVMEVYDLDKDKDEQLNQMRARNF